MRIAVPGAGELQCELSSLFHAYTKRFRISSNLCACALQYLVLVNSSVNFLEYTMLALKLLGIIFNLCACALQYLVLVNSSVNFLVYTMLASQFQTVFMEMFGMANRTKVSRGRVLARQR